MLNHPGSQNTSALRAIPCSITAGNCSEIICSKYELILEEGGAACAPSQVKSSEGKP